MPAAERTDGDLRREIRARLSQGRLVLADGLSGSRRGTRRPCIVCRGAIEPTTSSGKWKAQWVFLHAHEACYRVWRDESLAQRASTEAGNCDSHEATRAVAVIRGNHSTAASVTI